MAEKLGWQYSDANPSLERYIGRNLIEILGKQGEEAFHKCEAEILSHYIGKEHVVVVMEEAVIATKENRRLLSEEFVVYLKVSMPVQRERMKGGRTPLLPITNLKAFLDKQHPEGDHLFEEVATLTIESISIARLCRYLVKDVVHPWTTSTRQRNSFWAATVLRAPRCAKRASVCLPPGLYGCVTIF